MKTIKEDAELLQMCLDVAKKLNVGAEYVSFAKWAKSPDGEIPVFSIPSTHADLAQSLGLQFEIYD
jgi:hypothetical protein